ncbi:MAG TPA: DUF2723 domain-containing protein [Armatimonadota bacterium]|nr:DUF2723 domain-containing protein [Armatimonadota bacterium]
MEVTTSWGKREQSRDAAVALALGSVFFLVYLCTLCPTIFLGDSGEICSAIASGGVIHPPGYPFFSLLGRAALALVPWGEPAFRIGVVVALAAAGAVAALYRVNRELRASPWAAASAAACFATGYTFWSQSTRVEVYSLHVLLATLALLFALRYRRLGQPRELALMAVALSLGLAHHLTIVLLGPGLLALCWKRLWQRPGLPGRLARTGALLLAGPALYLLLILWARGNTLYAWGYTVDLPLLWNHVSARQYRSLLQFPDWKHLSQAVPLAGRLFTDAFPFGLCLLPLAGAAALWRRDRGIAAGLLAIAGVVNVYNLFYRIPDVAPYYLTAWMAAAACIAVALDAARERAPRLLQRPAIAAAVLMLVAGVGLVRNWAECDLSRATWVRESARHKLESTDPHAVLICQGDVDTFSLWYVRDVLKVRPDVLPLEGGLVGGAWLNHEQEPSQWYLHRLRREGVDVSMGPPRDRTDSKRLGHDGGLVELVNGPLRHRPLCVTFAAPTSAKKQLFFRWCAERYVQLPLGLVIRLHPKQQPVHLGRLLADNRQRWSRITLPNLDGVRMDQDQDPVYLRNLYARALVNYGGLYEMARDRRRAATVYRAALEWAPDSPLAAEALASVERPAAGVSASPSPVTQRVASRTRAGE